MSERQRCHIAGLATSPAIADAGTGPRRATRTYATWIRRLSSVGKKLGYRDPTKYLVRPARAGKVLVPSDGR